jgi:hypothetical protein
MYNKIKSKIRGQEQAGRRYEHYIKWLLTSEGWDVNYTGQLGFDDHGIDMIARKASITRYVQCKGWSWWKEMHEDVVNQLYGAVVALEGSEGIDRTVELYIYSPAKLSPFAQKQADTLHVHFARMSFPRWNRKHPFHKQRKHQAEYIRAR